MLFLGVLLAVTTFRDDFYCKKNFFCIKTPFRLILRPSKTDRRGSFEKCCFLHLSAMFFAPKRQNHIIFCAQVKFYMSKFHFKPIRSNFGHFSHGFFHPLFLLKKGFMKKKIFFHEQFLKKFFMANYYHIYVKNFPQQIFWKSLGPYSGILEHLKIWSVN